MWNMRNNKLVSVSVFSVSFLTDTVTIHRHFFNFYESSIIGDIVGKVGRTTIKGLLPNIVDRYKIDLVIANGENVAGGFGVTDKTAGEILNYGVHVITTGNHIWDKKDSIPYINKRRQDTPGP